MADTVYVSVTGLRLHSVLQRPRFSWHAMRSFSQATSAPGNLFTDARTLDGVQHTLTVWTSRDAMLDYMRSGAHRQAMKASPSIGMGKVVGYEASAVPSWSEALAVWKRDARAA